MSWQGSTAAARARRRASEAPDDRDAPARRPLGREREDASDGLAIGALCALCGVSARTVRYYEELGLLPGVRRRAGGRRIYGPDEVDRLRFVQRLKALGLSLAEIRELDEVHAIAGGTRPMLARLDGLLARRSAELEARIAELDHLRQEIGRYRQRVASRLAALDEGRRSA